MSEVPRGTPDWRAEFARRSTDTAMKEAIRMSDDVRALAQPVT